MCLEILQQLRLQKAKQRGMYLNFVAIERKCFGLDIEPKFFFFLHATANNKIIIEYGT